MMRRFLFFGVFLTFCFFNTTQAYARAWTQKEGHVNTSISYYYQEGSDYYDSSSKLKSSPNKFIKNAVYTYMEYGVTDTLTLTFQVPYDIVKVGNQTSRGIGDIEFGIIKNITKSTSSSFSFYGFGIVPTGYSIDASNIGIGRGYDRIGAEAGLAYGKSFLKGYIESSLGYRFYSGFPSDQIRAYTQGEYDINKYFGLYGMLDAQWGLYNGRSLYYYNGNVVPQGYRLVQTYLGIVLKSSFANFNIGYNKTLWGQNTGDLQGFYFGFSKSF
jgi:hypothetical protein